MNRQNIVMLFIAAIAAATIACGPPDAGSPSPLEDADGGFGACRIGFVFPDGDAGKWSGGYYTTGVPCPSVVSGNNFELATGNSAYDGWLCWTYGVNDWCCAPDMASKPLCDTELR